MKSICVSLPKASLLVKRRHWLINSKSLFLRNSLCLLVVRGSPGLLIFFNNLRSVVNILGPPLLAVFLIGLLVIPAALAQQRQAEQSDVIIRISTDLVQTDVTVLDKQGRPVEGLQRDQFELLVNGKPQNISFFEQVAAGSLREAVLVTAGGATPPDREKGKPPSDPGSSVVRGRTVFFFVDDMHLSPDSMRRTRETL